MKNSEASLRTEKKQWSRRRFDCVLPLRGQRPESSVTALPLKEMVPPGIHADQPQIFRQNPFARSTRASEVLVVGRANLVILHS